MNVAPQVLLVGAVAAVGVLHTIVPDHWVPITLIARRQAWTRSEVVRAAIVAGTGHTVSTLLIGVLVWFAGAALAARWSRLVTLVSSGALIAFGAWIAISSLREAARNGANCPAEERAHRRSSRTALLLILGSSPMVEGIPAFFAASRYGAALIATMAVVFASATISTYVVLCVSSVSGLQRVSFGRFERYGEVLSGGIIAVIGLVFLIVPVF